MKQKSNSLHVEQLILWLGLSVTADLGQQPRGYRGCKDYAFYL